MTTKDDPKLARKQALEAAKQSGILGSAALQQGGAFSSLTGTGDFSSGLDDKDIYGGLLGNEAGEMQGGFGLGATGEGPGGGGTGWGSIGTGRYGTIGHGSGTGSGYGVGSGRGMRGRVAAPQVRYGTAAVTGALDAGLIRRYLRRKLAQVRYCYEKQLLADPALAGKVAVELTISPSGNVTQAAATGMAAEVTDCIENAVRAIEFPRPKSDEPVRVRWSVDLQPAAPDPDQRAP